MLSVYVCLCFGLVWVTGCAMQQWMDATGWTGPHEYDGSKWLLESSVSACVWSLGVLVCAWMQCVGLVWILSRYHEGSRESAAETGSSVESSSLSDPASHSHAE
jgi:hypothetical protein